ncbi:gp53-like domain-containing protein [Phascolarctobacterium faecium]|uniref:gp53-like domain-containing protein n=1 Tax=Phascolarctobacterium faecium TaxID=33025 RepID=UPI003AB53F32
MLFPFLSSFLFVQWGYVITSISKIYVAFPISFTQPFSILSGTDHSGSPNAANTFYSVSSEGMYIGSAIAVGKSWIAIGV